MDLPLATGQPQKSAEDNDEIHRRRIAGYLSMRLTDPADVIFTNNRSTMMSSKMVSGRMVIRLHRLFRHADNGILDALANFVEKRSKVSSTLLDRFIAANRAEIRPVTKKSPDPGMAQGDHHDLLAALDRVNRAYFDGEVEVSIRWGRAPGRRKRRTKTRTRALAVYSYEDQTIRVSPVLDAADIPEFIIDWIVYHELLHHALPVEELNGKRRYHTRRFKMLERAFIQYQEAKAWEKEHIDRLLS
jgi:hypothetical protein